MTFTELGLPGAALDSVRKLGFETPTPIQAEAIPWMLKGEDVIGSAQTGTGKTAAFALPIISRLEKHGNMPRALILVPTRELACQVEESMRTFAQFTTLRVALLYGGVGYGKQLAALRKGADIIVATPGRLLDHLSRGTLKLAGIQVLVLDEADRMLDMGFLPDVKNIVRQIPAQRQTALFSATIPPQIESLIRWAMKSPRTIQIGERRSPAETVKHALYPVAEGQKTELLKELLKNVDYRSAIVFCRTRRGADRVGRVLHSNEHRVAVLHSDRSQREREQALAGFRNGRFKVLVATDIAARGIDVAEVTHVINYDVPQHPEDYVHRIGRTGRAQTTGDAYTIMVAEDLSYVKAIERFIGQRIAQQKVENFTYNYTSLFEEPKRGQAPAVGKVRAVRLSGGYYFGRSRARK